MELQPNLESVLNRVNSFINIDKHRQLYTKHFNNLRNNLFNNLKTNKVFNYMFNGWQLAGSYGDNVKVSLPNEFDLVFHVKFPEQSLINVVKDNELPGNVYLDFTKVLLKINNEKQHEENLKHLKKWIDENNHLKVEKFQSFIQDCFKNALSEMENKIIYDGYTTFLRYKREGPAHTIYVEAVNFNYSIDFVPGILLSKQQSVIPDLNSNWEAIPKPRKINPHSYMSFRASYYQAEHNLIQNKHQLKNAFRMMKKFRDTKSNMYKMKSYFIKTLFLFKATRETESYWRKPFTDIIIDMFKDLENSLCEENLPFFWDQKLNLYECYSPRLLREMLNCVEKARETLETAAVQLTIPLQNRAFCIFLTKAERNSLELDVETPAIIENIFADVKEITASSINPASDKTTCNPIKKVDISNECSEGQKNAENHSCTIL